MAVTVNNQFTGIDFRYLKDDALLGNNERSNAFGTTGKLYAIFLDNTTGSASASAYLKLFDTAATVVGGTTVPDFEFRFDNTATLHSWTFPEGLTFSNGFGYTASTGAGTTKGGNLAAVINSLIFVFK
tara:strand:+ start:150 stop:533 length:384 start_codon:yes stop_codon:yes gene_type:complete